MGYHTPFWPLKAEIDVHIGKTLFSTRILRAFAFDIKNNQKWSTFPIFEALI